MFLTKEELGSVMYGYQITQITQGDDAVILQAIAAAIVEVKSYLTANNKKEWSDGRLQYDVNAIFSAEGNHRNPLILEVTKTVSKWWIVQLCNADVIYEQAKERYDRAIQWLTKLSKGTVNLEDLAQLDSNASTTERQPFSSGSRAKFNHE
ncbi:DUF1320 family protein [Flavobacterium columnare]|uniref:DUF1320 domain-containing protein n=2 Tax=Flavobacterium columnare TaxID=996 RepID=A0AA94F487_9FLAO|nr:DUF1320 family protein [Flavobacterium columnare]MCH4831593.1 DUF1320 family protein [Flavobacterium columnare]MCH4831623.1 DUF1320 family protein [Flavobacterium columnare]MCH4831660.1 DUF1320 family protein [Flavobacterium columnare]MCH4832865.1 DUF1320 family protein [Flavobacterium columnare]